MSSALSDSLAEICYIELRKGGFIERPSGKKTVTRVILHQTDCLHVGIDDRSAHESEAALFQVLG